MGRPKKIEGIGGIQNDISDFGSILNAALNSTAEFKALPQDVTEIDEFISTGDKRLDIKIANRPNGGIGSGLITELLGWEGSGKSLMAAHMMADVQQSGGAAVLLDSEYAYESQQPFFRSLGIDTDKLVVRHPTTVEECFELIEKIIEIYKKSNDDKKKKKVIIVVDSITALPTKAKKEGGFSKEGYGMDKARIIGDGMTKLVQSLAKNRVTVVFCSQLRQKIGALAFAEQWTTSGGAAIKFYASTRLRITKIGKIKLDDEEKTIIGTQVEVTIEKNRLGPPHGKVKIDVYFDRGIDSDTTVIKFLKDKNIITGQGWYAFTDSKEIVHKFQVKTFKNYCIEHPEFAKEIYDKMCEMMIMPYRTDGISTEEGAQIEAVIGTGPEEGD